MSASKLLLVLAALVLAFAGCGDDETVTAGSDPAGSDSSGTTDSPNGQFDGEWTLVESEIGGSPFAPIAGFPITVEITGDQLRGNAGCNGFSGGFAAAGAALTIGDVAITEMGCMGDGVMEAEQTFIQSFWQTTGIERTGSGSQERLILTGDGITLNYIPTAAESPEAAELVGTLWILDTIIEGDAASSTIANVEDPSLKLQADGSFVAITGCREIIGTYSLDGQRLNLMFGMDDFACADELGDQERPILAVMEQASTISIDAKRLTLTADDGLNGLSFKAAE